MEATDGVDLREFGKLSEECAIEVETRCLDKAEFP